MSRNYVATIDGVLLKVGDRITSLYKDGGVPDGADPAHVQLLVDRGLLASADAEHEPEPAQPEAPKPPAKSANKDEWVAYAESQGTSHDDAEALTKDQLIEQFGATD
jgi:hypothetical protein